MHIDSPYYAFGKGTPPTLIRAYKDGQYVSAEDIENAWERYPDARVDPEFAELVSKARNGELRTKAGRPRKGGAHYLLHMYAWDEIDRIAAIYRAAKRRGSVHLRHIDFDRRGLMGCAQERVARKLRMGRGRSLANVISKLNRGTYFK